MADSPWGARFAGLKIVKEVNIQALSSVSDGSQEKSVGERVELTALDQSPFLLFIAFTHYLVFQHAVPEDKFVQACQIIAEIWPVLTGRYDATQPNLAITCTNEGFPVTIADWNDGKCTDFPSVLTFKQWNASLPASCAAPGLAHTIEGKACVLNRGPLFSIRLTILRDGGCVIALTCNHGLCDSAQLHKVTQVLAQACREEAVSVVKPEISRKAMRPTHLVEKLPDLQQACQKAAKLVSGVWMASNLQTFPFQNGFEHSNLPGMIIQKEKRSESLLSFADTWHAIFGDKEFPIWAAAPNEADEQSISNVVLLLEERDLKYLQGALKQQTEINISQNDLIVGLVWVMRALAYDFPLPGEQGSDKDFGSAAFDLNTNLFDKALVNYFGNTVDGLQIKIAPEDMKTESQSEVATVKRLQRAIRVAAISHREALDAARAGVVAESLFYRLLVPDQLERSKTAIDSAKGSGMSWRFGYSNLVAFENDESRQKLDFGTGPCKQIATSINRAGSFARLNVCPEGLYLQMYLPSSAPETITKKLFIPELLPTSRWLEYTETGVFQPSLTGITSSIASWNPITTWQEHAKKADQGSLQVT